jgi:hypothetical protein
MAGVAGLQNIYDENPGITAQQLYIKALKQNIDVNKKVVTDFVNRQGDKQVFAQRKTPGGETGPRDDKEAQMDLLDVKTLKTRPVGNYKFIIVLVIVFTRKAYLKGIENKTPDVVATGLREILDRAGELQVISSDQGNEWTGKVAKLLESRGIRRRLKVTADRNAIAVVDRLIGTLKLKLAKALTKQNKNKWDSEIKKVEESYNTSAHSHLMGESPDSIPDVVKYELFEQSAAAIEKNNELNTKRTDALLKTMHYRTPLPLKAFQRIDEQRYGHIREAQEIEAGLVKDTAGNTAPIKIVQVVDAGSSNVQPPGPAQAALKRKPGLQKYADVLKRYLLMYGAVALNRASRFVNQEERGFKEARGNLAFKQFLQLFPDFKTIGFGRAMKVDLR